MPARSLAERVEILEQKVGDLQTLPARVEALESHILQLRSEMHDGFSAILMRLDGHDQRFDQIDQRFVSVDQRFVSVDQRFDQIDVRFEETHRFMRVLHEEIISRLSLIEEGRGRRKRR
jgi:hypothetical protein